MDSKAKFEAIYGKEPGADEPERWSIWQSELAIFEDGWQTRDAEIAAAEREAVRKCAELLARKDGSFCNEIEVIRAAYPQHFAEVKPQPNPASPQPEF